MPDYTFGGYNITTVFYSLCVYRDMLSLRLTSTTPSLTRTTNFMNHDDIIMTSLPIVCVIKH